jgi:hypothetical protein
MTLLNDQSMALGWRNDGRFVRRVDPMHLTVTADPDSAFRRYRIYRQSDNALLANGGWDQARTREIRLWPEDPIVPPGDTLMLYATVWHPDPVRLTLELPWQS